MQLHLYHNETKCQGRIKDERFGVFLEGIINTEHLSNQNIAHTALTVSIPLNCVNFTYNFQLNWSGNLSGHSYKQPKRRLYLDSIKKRKKREVWPSVDMLEVKCLTA